MATEDSKGNEMRQDLAKLLTDLCLAVNIIGRKD